MPKNKNNDDKIKKILVFSWNLSFLFLTLWQIPLHIFKLEHLLFKTNRKTT